MKAKLNKLRKILSNMDSAVIAYSAGVDSTLLLKVAKDVLGKNVLAVTAKSETYPKAELRQAKNIAKKIGARHMVIQTKELKNPQFNKNPINRCYFCKKELFGKLKNIARKNKLHYVLDATNFDDMKDYRPGNKAKDEFKVKSPLKEAGLTKRDIRQLSKKLGLSTWDKPALACLASRIPYGQKITKVKLKKICAAENFLRNLGFRQVRVRHYDGLCRIEVDKKDIPQIANRQSQIVKEFKRLGFDYVTIDLEGYRSGSMNPALSAK